MKKHLLTVKLTFLLLFACGMLFAQPNPYIDPSSGLGQYGYIEKDATPTSFLLNSGNKGNIYQLFARTSINNSPPNFAVVTYGTPINSCGGTNISQSTNNLNLGPALRIPGFVYASSVHADYCGGGRSYPIPTAIGFSQRTFFVVDVAPTTNSVVSDVCYPAGNSNVVMSFTIANGNTPGQVLSKLMITNDGTAAEGTDIKNDAFVLYYEQATRSETFNGNESSVVLYGDYDGNPSDNNIYGNTNLSIDIPQNSTGGGLRCYVVLRGTSAYLSNSAKSKTVRIGIISDGMNITPNRDGSYSKLKMDLTRSSSAFLTINDVVTPTFAQVPPICAGAEMADLPTTSNEGYSGTWSPDLDNTTTTLYTFTPAAGQCASTTTMTIAVNPNVTYYADTDGDGYGDASSSLTTCMSSPAGFVSNSTDCNDANANVYRSGNFYSDADGDGYSNSSPVLVCYGAVIPAGYVETSLGIDCNDNDNFKHTEFPFYSDADGDSYGAGNLVSICAVNANTPPPGYSLNNADCNDDPLNGAAANPGVTEIYYNGIDDNCNGTIDEGRQITSQVLADRCGTTLTKIYQSINAEFRIAAVTGYRFRITNQSNLSDVQIIERPTAAFGFNQLMRYDYATEYSVDVMVQRNGIWLGYYGNACMVRTPDAPKLFLCGETVANKGTFLYSEVLLYATAYRFEVTNIATNHVTVLSQGRHYFTFNEIPDFTPGAKYSVKVAVKTTGDWSAYGNSCMITAPGGAIPQVPTDKFMEQAPDVFTVDAYPNPFDDAFALNIASETNVVVNVKVYDMLGKLIETRTVNATDVNQQKIGAGYPAGVYNIVVTVGENLKTFRVIKR